MTRAALTLALVVAIASGCKGKAKPASAPARDPDAPPPMTAVEVKRADDACKTYLAAVCACSQAKPDDAELAERCKLDVGMTEALDLVLQVQSAPDTERRDVLQSQQQARKLEAGCIERTAALASKGCAVPTPK